MGVQDRDWWRDAQKAREKREAREGGSQSNVHVIGNGQTRGLKWGPFGILVFWLAVMGVLYLAMNQYLKPKPVVVSASGDLIIPRARDGHFYASGTVNGKLANFLVDTGASLVTVSEQFAKEAKLSNGVSTQFNTANGTLMGRIVSDVPVSIGPLDVSGVSVAVGFVGHEVSDVLLGQSFLAKFDVLLQKDQMTLRKR